MIPNSDIKEALIARAKLINELVGPIPTGVLPDGLQGIREFSWKGTEFSYPCVRLEMESQIPTTNDSMCAVGLASWSWYVFSEFHSSKQADDIAGILVSNFRGISFSSNNVKFSRVLILESIPAISQDERTWRAQIRCQSLVT